MQSGARKKRILVLAESYPDIERPYAMSYVHSRSISYLEEGVQPVVGSFRSAKPYEIDGITVVPPSRPVLDEFDTIFCHAPNIRNHFRLLRGVRDKNIVFFIHGHEVLHCHDYPKPYDWQDNHRRKLQSWYDHIKLLLFPRLVTRLSKTNKVKFVFVSDWMKDQFCRRIRIDLGKLDWTVIPNGVHPIFRTRSYDPRAATRDVITIRPLDESKYGVDLVVSCAKANPTVRFDVYGKGSFFSHHPAPQNVNWIDQFIPQASLPELIGQYRLALMPTRYDAQGVSVCEMANFGIPTITSDIPICREMLSPFTNVDFVDNSNFSGLTLDPYLSKTANPAVRPDRFNSSTLASNELAFAFDGDCQ